MKDGMVKSKLAFLRLAEELGNVSKACQIYGYSRDSYYRMKKLYETGGEAALVDQTRDKPLLRNRVTKEIQHKLLELTFEQPEIGQKKMSEVLSAQGYPISPNGVRSVWLRYDLETKVKRITALKVKADRGEYVLSDKQLNAINVLADNLVNEQGQLATKAPGDLLIQDCIKFDAFPNIEPLYLHIAIDSYSRYVFANFSHINDSESVTQFFLNKVKAKLETFNISINRMLTDRGTEFLGGKVNNHYQNALADLGIKHLKIKAYNSSKINGLCFEYYQYILAHFYTQAARNHQIHTIEDLEKVFQEWLDKDNTEREDTSAYCFGNTHWQTLTDASHLSGKH
ncbi:helix-turn-helix domain-containing protein [Photobacterium sp. OFAV2-7]|uniref:helix-turn-helix domain-containing protein n=1 Tax=Photobacterium sp. OFAV2-7 TaxID=2917748 RepID=UPI001EF73AD5|nr:helix-turn-helix domain-containing protein [Photobacterium sp. OFAV2-7]MCG7586831.1 helix-turn-helix domain-containing protein [Photobacterium sp. OFAV2-7]